MNNRIDLTNNRDFAKRARNFTIAVDKSVIANAKRLFTSSNNEATSMEQWSELDVYQHMFGKGFLETHTFDEPGLLDYFTEKKPRCPKCGRTLRSMPWRRGYPIFCGKCRNTNIPWRNKKGSVVVSGNDTYHSLFNLR